MDVEFGELTYTIRPPIWQRKGARKEILRGVSGRFQPGKLSAIMGHSGAGKSSLLNALSGYTTAGVQGELLSNGLARDERLFLKSSCYITQHDVLQPLMTVRELMMFAAKLKLPSTTTQEERLAKINNILDTLGLTEAEDTRTEMLSGGQKKKLSVALELINNPPVLFLDEPTSGLDNVSAKHCVTMLQELARQGRTIICSIHQPSASLFELFDHVYVLSKGLCVYQGSTSSLLGFLTGAELPCPVTHNPADFVIEITNGENLDYINRLCEATKNGKIIWKESSAAISDGKNDKNENSVSDLDALQCEETDVVSHLRLSTSCQLKHCDSPISTFAQFYIILARMLLQFGRNRTALVVQTLHHTLCALLIGVLYYSTGNDGEKWFMHLKCSIAIIVFHAYTWMLIPILTYPFEAKLLKREYFNRWYNFNAYYFALTFSTIPSVVFFSTSFLIAVYLLWGLPSELFRLFTFCVIGIIVSSAAEGLGYIVGCTFSLLNGTAVGPALLASFLGLAVYGFDFAKDVPLWVNVVMQLSFMRNGVIALVLTVFGMGRGKMDCDDIFGYCIFEDPSFFLSMGELQDNCVWMEILKLFGLLLLFRVIFYVALRRRLKIINFF